MSWRIERPQKSDSWWQHSRSEEHYKRCFACKSLWKEKSLRCSQRLLSHTSKRKNESRDPRNYNTGLYCLLWTSQPVYRLIPCGCGSNQSTTQFRFRTDLSHGNEVACFCDQWSVSGALSNHRKPKHTMLGFGLQRSFGWNILELLVYYLMPNKCKNLKDMKSFCLSICTGSL